MNKQELIERIHALDLDPEDYIVVGSGILCALGIRSTSDIDIIVSDDLFDSMNQDPAYNRKYFEDGSYYLMRDEYEIGPSWDSENNESNLDDLKKDEVVIEGTPFVSLERLRAWKLKKGRPKDVRDVELINAYFER